MTRNNFKYNKKVKCDGRTDGRTNGRTDGWTDGWTNGQTNKAGCRVACTRLKISVKHQYQVASPGGRSLSTGVIFIEKRLDTWLPQLGTGGRGP